MSVTIPADDRTSADELVRRGFRLAERSIPIEIPLGRFQSSLAQGKKSRLLVRYDWDLKEVFSLAKNSFETDGRFALDMEQNDTALKNELLLGYISELKEVGAMSTCLYSSDGLEGFNLWVLQGDTGRVVLGAMAQRYRGTGMALSLYSQTAIAMRANNVVVLRDIVACSNTASLNLHSILIRNSGGVFRFGTCLDQYKRVGRVGVSSTGREKGQ